MLAFALDHPTPATIILITGDRDYAYAVSTLKLRKYQVILVVPSSPHISPSLESQASLVIDWGAAVLRTRTEAASATQAVRQPYLDLDPNLVTKLLRELQDPPLDGPDATIHPYSNASQSIPRLRRISTRDLLEPSRHCKNTGSFDSTQEFTDTPASPRKSTNTGSDPAPAGLPIPKTPSRSRRGSVSAGSTRARSATIVAQSPPQVEQDIPAKNPTPPGVGRSSASDITDLVGPAKNSPPILPSLDTLELPMRDSCPPSSIIIRSPPDSSSQSVPVSGKSTIPSSHKLNCLASPFVLTKAPTGWGSIPSSCTKQFHTTTRPTFPVLPPTKSHPGTVSSACETPQIKDIGVLTEIERLTHSHIEDSDTDSTLLIPYPIHSKEGACDVTDTPMSNYHSHVTPTGLRLTNTPSSKHISPPAPIPLGGGVNSQSVVFARTLGRSAPGSESVPSSSTFPSTPFITTESHEHDESGRRQTWTMFKPLIDLLLAARERGIARPTRSTIALDLVQSNKQVYQHAGVSRFRDYTALAEQAGIIELGGREGGAWIALHPNWFRVDGVTTTHSFSNTVSSPTSDPPQAAHDPLLTGPKSPLIEKTVIFQTPTFTSPKFNSLENSNTPPTSPTDRQDCASRASIPAQFQPLIDILLRMRAEGLHQILRSLVGQLLGQDVYAQAGVSGFKEYVHQASEAQLVQCGGVGGHAWIRLHPELPIQEHAAALEEAHKEAQHGQDAEHAPLRAQVGTTLVPEGSGWRARAQALAQASASLPRPQSPAPVSATGPPKIGFASGGWRQHMAEKEKQAAGETPASAATPSPVMSNVPLPEDADRFEAVPEKRVWRPKRL